MRRCAKATQRDRGIRVPENAAGGPRGSHARVTQESSCPYPQRTRRRQWIVCAALRQPSSFFGVGIGVSVILSIAAFPLFVPAAASSRKWSGLSAITPSRFDERFSWIVLA